MQLVFEIIFPVCLIGLLGYGASAFNIVRDDASEVIGDFVFKIAIPVLLFRMAATADLQAVNPWQIWGTYFSGVLVVWFLAGALLPILFKREISWGVIAGAASGFANTVLVGIPIVNRAYGDEGMLALTLLLTVHLPTLLLITSLHYEAANALQFQKIEGAPNDPPLLVTKRFFKSLATNFILIAILFGVLVNLSGITFPAVLNDVIGQIATVAGPLALVVLGMSLRNYGLSGNVRPALMIGLLKLIIMPLVVFLTGHYVIGLSPVMTAAMVLVAACPSGVNSFLFANYFRTGQALAANSIMITTILSVVSLSVWLLVMADFLGR